MTTQRGADGDEEQFLLVLSGGDTKQEWLEVVSEPTLGRYVDGADFLPVDVQAIYVLRHGQLVRCHFEAVERKPYPDPENEESTIYAYSHLYAGNEKVASIPLTDH